MVDSGNCSYVTQVRNIEKMGGALAIIVDPLEEDISDVILSDDGTGAGIRIPAMMINKYDGKILKEYLQKDSQTSLRAEFMMEQAKNNIVDASIWYSSSDDKAIDFVKNMAEYIEPIINHVNFQPKFVTWACPHCDSAYKRKNCVSNGKYCAMQSSHNNDIDGVEIIMENLREHCIFNLETKDKEFEGSYKSVTHKGRKTIYFEYVARAH